MRTYEVLFILSPQVTEEEATTLINDFKGIAESIGATLKSEDAWGRRRLAYPIHKFNEGIYHLLVLESDQALSELDRRMKNIDRVLRHVIVRTDLEQKRADKLARRNPKKERVRTAPVSVPMAPAEEPAAEAPVSAAPEAPVDAAPEAPVDATPEAPVSAAPEETVSAAATEETAPQA